MAATITHKFVSAIPDGADTSVVRPSNWNDTHDISGTIDTANGGTGVDGSAASNGQLLIGNGSGYTLATLTQGVGVTITNGAGSITIAASGSSSTWDTIGAAAGDGSTNNGTNRIVYNTAPTADSRIAWRFTESAAATNGTSTTGVPNQVLLQLDTVAASTQSPLKVLSRGSFVFAVSPSAAQILGANGSSSNPTYSFAGATQNGMYNNGGDIVFATAANIILTVKNIDNRPQIQVASLLYFGARGPAYSCTADADTGFTVGSAETGVCISQIENTRWGAGKVQVSKGSADAVSYAMNFRKSRGTVASPTVITTGDVLETKSAYAYLGATNTYRETSRYEVTSAGTISDATTGVGSIVTIYGKTQGTDATVQPTVVITGGSTATIKFAGTGMTSANGSVATVLGSVGPTGAATTVQEWLTVIMPGGSTRYIPCF